LLLSGAELYHLTAKRQFIDENSYTIKCRPKKDRTNR